MTTTSLMPTAQQRYFTNAGAPADGYLLYTYAAGTSTPKATYTDSAGTTPHANPIELSGKGEAVIYWDGAYKVDLKSPAGASVTGYPVDNVISYDAMENTAASDLLRTDIAAVTVTKGVGLVGLDQTLNYATSSIGWTVASQRRWNPAGYPWLAKFDGATDDTAALLACITALYNAGGGTMVMPAGTAGVTSVVFNWAAAKTVNIEGAGEYATFLQKIGATTTPVLDFSGLGAGDGAYSTFSNFSIVGSAKSGHGLRMTTMARHVLRNVRIQACDVGWEVVGSLIMETYDCNFQSNNIGVRTRKSGAYYCNLITMNGGSVRGNTTWGFDIGDANGFNTKGVDIEVNGTSLNLATGQVIIRSTVDDEIGFANISFSAGWFEGGLGTNILVEAASSLILSFFDLPLISSEAGVVMTVGAINRLVLERVIAGSPGDTVTVAATNCIIRDSIINTLTDTSTNRFYNNLNTSAAGLIQLQVTTPSGTYVNSENAVNSGTASVASTSGVAVTLFAASLTKGALYDVFAYVDSVGSVTTMANARIGVDRAGTYRMGGEDGASMTITVSGNNIQATQSTGAGQTITCRYHRIG